MLREVFALVTGSNSRHLLFNMAAEKILSIFVDESGSFKHTDALSPFYIIGLVLHDQSIDIRHLILDLERSEQEIGLDGHCFHAGPLIRKEKGYSVMSRPFRGKILSRMMAFIQRVDFKYHCLCVNKMFVDSAEQIIEHLRREFALFIQRQYSLLSAYSKIKVYYDCGQSPVTNLLHDVLTSELNCAIEFAQNVRPEKYRMFQVADLLCTFRLIEERINHGLGLTLSEMKFFGGPRDFKRNFIKKMQAKII